MTGHSVPSCHAGRAQQGRASTSTQVSPRPAKPNWVTCGLRLLAAVAGVVHPAGDGRSGCRMVPGRHVLGRGAGAVACAPQPVRQVGTAGTQLPPSARRRQRLRLRLGGGLQFREWISGRMMPLPARCTDSCVPAEAVSRCCRRTAAPSGDAAHRRRRGQKEKREETGIRMLPLICSLLGFRTG